MSNGTISVRYARALLRYATEEGCQQKVYTEMQTLMTVLNEVPQIRERLVDPTLPPGDKQKLLSTAVNDNASSVSLPTEKFIELVVKAGRADMMLFMAASYIDLYRESNGILPVVTTTMVPLTATQKAKLEKMVLSLTPGTVEWTERTDPSIEGGFMIQVDGYRLDATVAGQISRIRKELIEKNNRVI